MRLGAGPPLSRSQALSLSVIMLLYLYITPWLPSQPLSASLYPFQSSPSSLPITSNFSTPLSRTSLLCQPHSLSLTPKPPDRSLSLFLYNYTLHSEREMPNSRAKFPCAEINRFRGWGSGKTRSGLGRMQIGTISGRGRDSAGPHAVHK